MKTYIKHDYNDLIRLFNSVFLDRLNTELLLGGDDQFIFLLQRNVTTIKLYLHVAIMHQRCMNSDIGVLPEKQGGY